MNVVYAFDDRYAMIAATSMESLLQNHARADALRLHALGYRLSMENKRKLLAVASRHHRTIRFVDVPEALVETPLHVGRWSVAAFARLFAADLLPDVSRILYLDCDVLVDGPLHALYETDLGAYACAATSEPLSALHKRNVGKKARDVYFNSGVMLIDLEKWRAIGAKDRFLMCLKNHHGRVPYVDQGVLNEVFGERILTLPARYNVYTEYFDFSCEEMERYRADRIVYPKKEIEDARKAPVLLHFTQSFLTARPWCEGSRHPYAEAWRAVRAATPWKDEPLWKDRAPIEKRVFRWIVRHTPRTFGVYAARVGNSVIRPLLDSAAQWALRQGSRKRRTAGGIPKGLALPQFSGKP